MYHLFPGSIAPIRFASQRPNGKRGSSVPRPASVVCRYRFVGDFEKARALAPVDRRADRSGVHPPAPVYRINIVVRLDVRLARSLALADASAGGIDLLAKRHLALRVRARGRTRNSAKSLGTDSKVGS